VFSRGILQFMRDLDTPEIHGYVPEFGYRVYTQKAIEMVSGSLVLKPAAEPLKTPKKKPAKRGESNGDGTPPEVGHDELIGQQFPGDAVQTSP
jgi:arginine decarboxylase